jgi:hypothetical protein
LYPITPEEALASQLKPTECASKETPVPLSCMTVGELEALLVIFMLPVICFALFGAKVTSRVADWPDAIVAPFKPLLMAASIPVKDICERVKLELPVFFSVTASFSELPTVSLPKFRTVGDAVTVRVAAAPAPLKGIVSSVAPRMLLKVTVPVLLPD